MSDNERSIGRKIADEFFSMAPKYRTKVRLDEFINEKVWKFSEAKDQAYKERNQLVCALSKLFPSWMEKHPKEDILWDDDWRNIVFIDLPTGQCSWHIHDSEKPMFDHLIEVNGNSWDGHTTEEKYKRIGLLPPMDGDGLSVKVLKRINKLRRLKLAYGCMEFAREIG